MTDLAVLGMRFETQNGDNAIRQLDGVAASAGKAETATDRLSRAARRGTGLQESMTQAMMQQKRVMDATRSAMGLTAAEGLNMSRQFTDIGVQMAMGMSPFLIAVQQGPQIFDIFQQSAIRTGTTVTAAMNAMAAATWRAMAPFLPLIAAAGAAAAVVGGTLALSVRSLDRQFGHLTEGMGLTEKQLEKVQNKGVTMGDVLAGTLNYLRDIIWDRVGPAVTAIGDWFSKAMDVATRALITGTKAITGGFIGSFRAIKAVWGDLPAVLGDVAISAANASIRALEWLVNRAIDGINAVALAANPIFAAAKVLTGGDLTAINHVNFGEITNRNAGAARAAGQVMGREFAAGMAEGSAMVDRQGAAWMGFVRGAGQDRIWGEAGEAEAARLGGADPRVIKGIREDLTRIERINPRPLQGAFFELLHPLQLVADEMRLIDSLARDTAQGLASAFGESGRALGDLLTAMSGFQSRQAAINLDMAKGRISEAQAIRAMSQAQLQHYGDMAGAARGFFKEGSDGYQALMAVEQVYRALQLAGMMQSMMMNGQETAFTVGQNFVRAASHGVVAVARAMASLPFPFNLAAGAATIAALAAIGVKIGGGGGSGGGSGSYNPAPINTREQSVATARGQAAAAHQSASTAQAAPSKPPITFDLRGAVMTTDLLRQMEGMAAQSAHIAVKTSEVAIPAQRARRERVTMGGGRR